MLGRRKANEVKKGVSKMFNFKMNKNKKINKKKSGIHSFPAMIIVLMMLFGFLFMLTIFAKMAVINREEIRKEAEAGNELIRIYISIDEEEVVSTATTTLTTTSGTQTQTITTTTPILSKTEKTRITITNQWGKTSIIDYFVIEDWNGGMISKGDLNIILGAGEERIFKGNDILTTFKLSDVGYAEDFWFFKSKIRCITLHTILGNTFGSAYKPTGYKTITHRYYYINYTAITFNQTFTTTYYGSYTLKIESHGPFQISPRDDNPIWYKVLGYDSGGNLKFSYNVMYDIISPNQDPYGNTYYDGQYVYPAGILLTVSHSLPRTIYAPSGGRIYVTNDYNDIGPYSKISIFVNKLELWELDQFGNEVRKILETTSSSISFAMFGNYKLKRYFGYTATEYNPPPATTVTYTITATGSTTTTIRRYADFNFPRSDGAYHDVDVTINPLRGGWWIKYDGKDLVQDAQYVAEYEVYIKENPNYAWLTVKITLRYKDNAPYTANAIVRVYYITWGPT
jgi:hypothetical protein